MSVEALESLQLPVHYDSFLLRTWRTTTGGKSRWMIENVMTGERHVFTELADLVLFLRSQAHGMADDPYTPRPARHRRSFRHTNLTNTSDSAKE